MHSRTQLPSVLDYSQLGTTARFSGASRSYDGRGKCSPPKLYLLNYSNRSLTFSAFIPKLLTLL